MALQAKYISALTVASVHSYHVKSLARPFSLIIFRIFRNTTREDANGWCIASKESNPDAG